MWVRQGAVRLIQGDKGEPDFAANGGLRDDRYVRRDHRPDPWISADGLAIGHQDIGAPIPRQLNITDRDKIRHQGFLIRRGDQYAVMGDLDPLPVRPRTFAKFRAGKIRNRDIAKQLGLGASNNPNGAPAFTVRLAQDDRWLGIARGHDNFVTGQDRAQHQITIRHGKISIAIARTDANNLPRRNRMRRVPHHGDAIYAGLTHGAGQGDIGRALRDQRYAAPRHFNRWRNGPRQECGSLGQCQLIDSAPSSAANRHAACHRQPLNRDTLIRSNDPHALVTLAPP